MRDRGTSVRDVTAQLRVLVGLVSGFEPPVLGAVLRRAAGAPRVEEAFVGGVPATVYRPPRGPGPWPAVVVFPGVTRRGRAHPALIGLARAVAATGQLAVVAEPDGAAIGELTPETLRQATAAAVATAELPKITGGRVAITGVSGGATLALLAASADGLAERVSAVVALAPCCDIREAIRVVTCGAYRDGDRLRPFATGGLFELVVARSVTAWLPPGADRDALHSHVLALDYDEPDPLRGLREWPRAGLERTARLAVELLGNEDPGRFDELFAALPLELRQAVDVLSPMAAADLIRAPVELVVARVDKYIPLADAASYVARCETARLTVLESLAHAVPAVSPTAAADLMRLDAVLVRALSAVRAASYSRP